MFKRGIKKGECSKTQENNHKNGNLFFVKKKTERKDKQAKTHQYVKNAQKKGTDKQMQKLDRTRKKEEKENKCDRDEEEREETTDEQMDEHKEDMKR